MVCVKRSGGPHVQRRYTMAEPALLQLEEALHDLETFGIGGRWRLAAWPTLPALADSALMDHLARGLQGAVRVRGSGPTAFPRADLIATVRELRAAVAL